MIQIPEKQPNGEKSVKDIIRAGRELCMSTYKNYPERFSPEMMANRTYSMIDEIPRALRWSTNRLIPYRRNPLFNASNVNVKVEINDEELPKVITHIGEFQSAAYVPYNTSINRPDLPVTVKLCSPLDYIVNREELMHLVLGTALVDPKHSPVNLYEHNIFRFFEQIQHLEMFVDTILSYVSVQSGEFVEWSDAAVAQIAAEAEIRNNAEYYPPVTHGPRNSSPEMTDGIFGTSINARFQTPYITKDMVMYALGKAEIALEVIESAPAFEQLAELMTLPWGRLNGLHFLMGPGEDLLPTNLIDMAKFFVDIPEGGIEQLQLKAQWLMHEYKQIGAKPILLTAHPIPGYFSSLTVEDFKTIDPEYLKLKGVGETTIHTLFRKTNDYRNVFPFVYTIFDYHQLQVHFQDVAKREWVQSLTGKEKLEYEEREKRLIAAAREKLNSQEFKYDPKLWSTLIDLLKNFPYTGE